MANIDDEDTWSSSLSVGQNGCCAPFKTEPLSIRDIAASVDFSDFKLPEPAIIRNDENAGSCSACSGEKGCCSTFNSLADEILEPKIDLVDLDLSGFNPQAPSKPPKNDKGPS